MSFSFQEWEERTEEDGRLEPQQKKDEDRKRIREEKARLARLAAIQVRYLWFTSSSFSIATSRKFEKTDAAETKIAWL